MSSINAIKILPFVVTAVALLSSMADANAVPSFKRQTGLECTSCHVSWLELSPVGRKFKLNGYTLGERKLFPIAAMIQASRTTTSKDQPADSVPHDGDIVLQQASVFLAGKWTDNIGSFIQWTFNGVEHHSGIDNADIRYSNSFGEADNKVIYGVTLHNNPTVQDVYNTTPAFGFPYAASPTALSPNAATLIDGGLGQQVVGLGAYALWRNTVYTELSAYRTANQLFDVFRAGQDRSTAAQIKGYNPYWRLALQHEWDSGKHSAMVGTYGFIVNKYPDSQNQSGPTDHFTDTALDAQYQYIGDRHRASAQLNFINEKQNWNASFPAGGTENASNTLKSFRAKGTYYFDNKYGVNLAYFATKGSNDQVLYNSGEAVSGSAAGGPNSSGYIVELNYLPRRDIRLVAQYTAYNKFNGASNNYDGQGRNAKDNNSLYLLAWFMF